MREGGARALLNDLITQVQALATVVAAGQASTQLPEMMGAELVKLDEVKAALAQLHSDMTAPDSLLPYVDGLEGLIAATNAKLDALAGFTDGLETLIGASNTLLTAIRDGQIRQSSWSAVAAGGSLIVGTTAALLKGAAGAGLRNRITNLQFSNSNGLTVARIDILDDATVIWSGSIAPNATVGFPVDLLGSVNKAMNVKLATSLTGGILVNAQGTITN